MVSEECQVCQLYRKPPPHPTDELPMATIFQECIIMDFYKGKIYLHLIDHATRMSSQIFVKSKKLNAIINGIFKCWIQISGAPEKLMTDNGGEFANESFINNCKDINIK